MSALRLASQVSGCRRAECADIDPICCPCLHQAQGYAGTANEQVVFRGGDFTAACALSVEAESGVTVEVKVSASGGSNSGDVVLDGGGGSLVLSTPVTGAVLPGVARGIGGRRLSQQR